jgi:RNA polymerase sigma-70 factor (ECF subfamily)
MAADAASSSDLLTEDDFGRLVAPLRPALRLHCYRLVGTLDDAEDMVQETLVRAWRQRNRLYDLSGFHAWLYRIATNACLDYLDRLRRRRQTMLSDAPELGWPDPLPDAWLVGITTAADDADLADQLIRRERVGLAFLAAVQLLAPRQRAILVLRDVLDWPAAAVAEALGTTTAAVNSALQRARAALRDHRLEESAGSWAGQSGAEVWEVARRYLEAWERADITALTALLTADARMAMPPDPRAFEGRASIISYFESAIFSESPARRIRLALTTASRQPAFVVLQPDPATGELVRIGLKVLFIRGRSVVEIRGYMRADLAARFDQK